MSGPEGLRARAIEVWEHNGLPCAIVPNPHAGFFNGYVQLPEGHPYRSGDYENIPVDVHGGLTYADGDGWVGFDTGHFGDVWAPDDLTGHLDEQSAAYFGAGGVGGYMRRRTTPDPFEHQWTLPLLRAEVERLAEQLSALSV